MLNINQIDQLFDYSTENKDNDQDKHEKCNRRIETICVKVSEVRETIYSSNKGVVESIFIVNEKYSRILDTAEILRAVKQIKAFYKIISNSHVDIDTKATVIRTFDFKHYKALISSLHYTPTWLKSFSRLSNMKLLADKYLQGGISKRNYSDDLKEQVLFFEDLISKYEDINSGNCYAYILRHDLKTIKKKKRPNNFRI